MLDPFVDRQFYCHKCSNGGKQVENSPCGSKKKRVLELLDTGLPARDIASQAGCSLPFVYAIARVIGRPFRKAAKTQRRQRRSPTLEQIKQDWRDDIATGRAF